MPQLAIYDVNGREYKEGVLYDLPKIYFSGSIPQHEGKSEKPLHALFGMLHKEGRGEGHDGLMFLGNPWREHIEIKDLETISSSVRDEPQAREHAFDLRAELYIMLRTARYAAKALGEEEDLAKIDFLLKDVRRGNIGPKRILDGLAEFQKFYLAAGVNDALSFTRSPVAKNVFLGMHDLLDRLRPSQTFVTPEVIFVVLKQEHFFFVTREHYDEIFVETALSSGHVNYKLTKDVQRAVGLSRRRRAGASVLPERFPDDPQLLDPGQV